MNQFLDGAAGEVEGLCVGAVFVGYVDRDPESDFGGQIAAFWELLGVACVALERLDHEVVVVGDCGVEVEGEDHLDDRHFEERGVAFCQAERFSAAFVGGGFHEARQVYVLDEGAQGAAGRVEVGHLHAEPETLLADRVRVREDVHG